MTGTTSNPCLFLSRIESETAGLTLGLITLAIGVLTLFVACISIRVSRKIQKRNEKHLRYSFWLDFHLKDRKSAIQTITNTRTSSKELDEKLINACKKSTNILELYKKDFPDPIN